MHPDQAVGAPERLHPLFLVTGMGRALRRMLGGYAAIGYFAATGNWRNALFVLAALAVVMVVGVILYWRRFEYRVGANEIRIDSGILSRTHRSIPFDRIQDVDITQGPLARLLGLARVEFETGGSAGAKSDDGALAAIALPRAEALRRHVRARQGTHGGGVVDAMAVASIGADGVALDEVEQEEAATPPIFAMDLRRVLTAGMFNFSLAVIAALFGASQSYGDVAGFDFFERKFWNRVIDAGSPMADLVLAHQIVSVVAGIVVLIVTGLSAGIARTVLREYRFRLDRTPSGLRRRRGLLTLTDVTLPLRRVQAAIIATGPLRERFGWKNLKLQSLGKDEGKQGDHVVAPLANDGEVAAILDQLGWRRIDQAIAWQRVSAASAWGFTLAVALLLIPATIQMVFIPPVGVAAVVVVATMIATRWLGWRRYRYALDGERLLVRSGWWRRRLIILPLANIQSVDLTENILGRRLGIASLHLGVASGRGFSNHAIIGLPRATARTLRSALLAAFA